jgi:hypothetical protein
MTVAQPKRRSTEPLASIVFSVPWAYLAEMAMEMPPEVEDWASFLKRLCDQYVFLADVKGMRKVIHQEDRSA